MLRMRFIMVFFGIQEKLRDWMGNSIAGGAMTAIQKYVVIKLAIPSKPD
jgi:hypothetical protein